MTKKETKSVKNKGKRSEKEEKRDEDETKIIRMRRKVRLRGRRESKYAKMKLGRRSKRQREN